MDDERRDAEGNPIRSVVIDAATARSAARTPFPDFKQSNLFFLDPDRPKLDPNELLNSLGGRMTDPHAMNHNCPFCHRTMGWDLFRAHMRDCQKRWRRPRSFTGATPEAP